LALVSVIRQQAGAEEAHIQIVQVQLVVAVAELVAPEVRLLPQVQPVIPRLQHLYRGIPAVATQEVAKVRLLLLQAEEEAQAAQVEPASGVSDLVMVV
jgi:hypothetical protein